MPQTKNASNSSLDKQFGKWRRFLMPQKTLAEACAKQRFETSLPIMFSFP
jgi:hypothetical protein